MSHHDCRSHLNRRMLTPLVDVGPVDGGFVLAFDQEKTSAEVMSFCLSQFSGEFVQEGKEVGFIGFVDDLF